MEKYIRTHSNHKPLGGVLTESALRRMAGARSFERGMWYFNGKHVRSIASQTDEITGKVEGTHVYKVRLWVDRDSLNYSCTCPMGQDGECCKHCVALGLVWLSQEASAGTASLAVEKRSNKKSAVTMRDVRAYLSTRETEALVDLLMQHAEQDENLRRRLLMMAAKKAANGPDVATYRQAIEDAIVPDSFVSYDEMYDYAHKADEVIDSLEDLLKEGHAASAVDLTEHALRSVEKAMESVDDSAGHMGEILERLQDLHHVACKRVKPDPEELAKRLFEWELHGEWDTFDGAVDRYADVLGKQGLDVYRQLAEQRWRRVSPLGPGDRDPAMYGERFRITQIMEALARRTGDVETIVAIKQRDLSSSWAYLQIAETYRKTKKHDLALEWAERGVKAFPQDRDDRLRKFLAEEYHRRKRHDEAMALLWADFEKAPQLDAYRNLKTHADKIKQWSQWRERALMVIRDQIDRAKLKIRDRRWIVADHSALVEIFLWEKDFESAWREAKAGGCHDGLWRTLAAWREKDHPQDAIPFYWKDVDNALQHMGNESYREAVRLLRKIRLLMRRIDQEEKFGRELAALRAAHKAKRNFMKLLDHAKWE
jgi:uncharacterized Zn finger protein